MKLTEQSSGAEVGMCQSRSTWMGYETGGADSSRTHLETDKLTYAI